VLVVGDRSCGKIETNGRTTTVGRDRPVTRGALVKFRIDRDVLADGVGWAARTLPSRPTLPVLAALRLDAGEDTLRVAGYDHEVFGEVTVPAEVADAGVALVSGRLLADIVRSLPSRPVDMVCEAGKVSVTCGSSRFTLQSLPVEEYPSLPDLPETVGRVPGALLAEAVSQVAVASGRDDMLPVLTGIRIEIDGDLLTLAATDRYRLAVRELPWQPARPGTSAVALVPARSLAETARSLGHDDVEIGLGASGLLGLATPDRRSTARLIDGEFPKYRTLFPSESSTIARVDTAALVESVKRVSLVADRNSPVRLTFGPDEVTLEASSGDDAQASESLPAQVTGEGLTIGFNPGYFLDGLGAIDAPTAVLAFTQPARPAVLQGADDLDAPPDPDYRYLLMPVRLAG
jgi:DNA polymerase-3 subunit beta